MTIEQRGLDRHTPRALPFLPSHASADQLADVRLVYGRSPSRHLDADQYGKLLGVIDDLGGIASLDEISHALPSVEQPVSAVSDLCEADILCADWESAFDGDMRVWRVDR